MDMGLSVPEYEKIFEEKRILREEALTKSGLFIPASSLPNLPSSSNGGSDLVIENLVWWSGCVAIPDSLRKNFQNGVLNLGSWFDATIKDLGSKNLPSEISQHLVNFGGRLGCSSITWRSLYKDPVFATFISKLFQNSFRDNVVKQDFRLTYDRSLDTLIGLVYKHIGTKKLGQVLKGGRLDVFNSSSFALNLLLHLIRFWDSNIHVKGSRKTPLYKAVYKSILNRIAKRRTLAKVFFYSESTSLSHLYPLKPFVNPVDKTCKATQRHILRKHKIEDGLHIKAITRSSISEHERHTNYTDYYVFNKKKRVRARERFNSVC
jgi:hypothetical protein